RGTIQVRDEVMAAYADRMDRELAGTVWNDGGCSSWYIDSRGRNSLQWPTFTYRYHDQVTTIDPTEYVLASASEAAVREVETEKRVLDDLRHRRVDPVLATSQSRHRDLELHRLDEDLDERRRVGAHDVRAQEQAGGPVGDELAAAHRILHRPAVGHIAVFLGLDGDVVSRRARLLLGAAHGRDLRPGEHGIGDEGVVERLEVVGVTKVVSEHALLVTGHVLELMRRAHVAQGPDAVRGRAAELVDVHPVAVHPDAGRVQSQEVAVGGAARPQQEGLTRAGGPVLEGQLHPPAIVAGRGDPGDVLAQPDVPVIPGVSGEALGELAVEVLEQHVGAAHHGDLHPQ